MKKLFVALTILLLATKGFSLTEVSPIKYPPSLQPTITGSGSVTPVVNKQPALQPTITGGGVSPLHVKPLPFLNSTISGGSNVPNVLSIYDFKGGLYDNSESYLIPDNCSPDMANFIIDKNNGLEKRKGSSLFDTLTQTQRVRALFQYKKSTGISYLIGQSSGTLYYSTGGEGVSFYTAFDDNYEPSFTVANDKLYVTNGKDTVITWDGTTVVTSTETPKGKYIVWHKNRLWVANIGTSKALLQYSDNLNSENFSTTLPYEGGAVQVNKNDGQQITGLLSWNDQLLIFKEGSVWTLQGYALENFTLRAITQETGCSYGQSIAVYKGVPMWLSSRGVEALINNEVQLISKNIDTTIKTIQQLQNNQKSVVQTSAADWLNGTYDAYWATSTANGSITLPSATTTHIATIDSFVSTGGVACCFDSTGNVHILYVDNDHIGGLYYTMWFSSSQSVGEPILLVSCATEGADSQFENFDIVCDNINVIHIAYYDKTGGNLSYSSGTYLGGFSDSYIDTTGDVGQYCKIDVKSTNKPAIIYNDVTNDRIKVAEYDTSWTLTTLDTTSKGYGLDIKYDSNNMIYLAYVFINTNYYVQVASGTSAGSAINLMTIDNTGYTVNGCSLDVTPTRRYVVYSRLTEGAYYLLVGSFTNTTVGSTISGLSGMGTGKENTAVPSIVWDNSNSFGEVFCLAENTSLQSYPMNYHFNNVMTTTNSWVNFAGNGSSLVNASSYSVVDSDVFYDGTKVVVYALNYRGVSNIELAIGKEFRNYTTFTSTYFNAGTSWQQWIDFNSSESNINGNETYRIRTATAVENLYLKGYNNITNNGVIVSTAGGYAQIEVNFLRTACTEQAKVTEMYLNYIDSTTAKPPVACVYDYRYWLSVSTSNNTNGLILVFDNNGAWTKFTGINADSLCLFNNKLYSGDSSATGRIFQQDIGTDDNGVDINAYWYSKIYFLGSVDSEKLLHKIYYTVKANNDVAFALHYIDVGRGDLTQISQEVMTGTTFVNKQINFANGLRIKSLQFLLDQDSLVGYGTGGLTFNGLNVYYDILLPQ